MIKIILCVDTEPDRAIFGSEKLNKEKGDIKLRGIEIYSNKIEEAVKSLKDDFGNEGKLTWFVRADEQIKTYFGTSDFLFKKFSNKWNGFKKNKDEIAWHIHMSRWNGNNWMQETSDVIWMKKNLVDSKIQNVKSARIGWHFMNNTIMNTLEKLKIKYELSALPGLKSSGKSLFIKLINYANGAKISNIYDWVKAKNKPYHPSKENYQLEGKLRILEIPVSVYKKKPWVFCAPLSRNKEVLKSAIKNENILVGEMHADDLCMMDSKKWQIFKLMKKYYTSENIRQNLDFIIKLCKKRNIEYGFITPKELAKSF